jgi:hypothetical protein
MGRTSRKSSEDQYSARKRSRKESNSPRRSSSDKCKYFDDSVMNFHQIDQRKRDDKKDGRSKRRERSRSRSSRGRSLSKSPEVDHVQTRRMSLHAKEEAVANGHHGEGDFSNFPAITQKSREGLIKRGITHLFQVQFASFNKIMDRKDLIVRDLTGSGKTLGFSLPMVEYFRKNKCFGTGKI